MILALNNRYRLHIKGIWEINAVKFELKVIVFSQYIPNNRWLPPVAIFIFTNEKMLRRFSDNFSFTCVSQFRQVNSYAQQVQLKEMEEKIRKI